MPDNDEKPVGLAVDDIGAIISVVNTTFSSNPNEVKKALKEGFWKALETVTDKDKPISPAAGEEHKLAYNSTSETLEPVYFWILDFMNGAFDGGVEKLTDNFASSPGSGHFAEMGARSTKMQEEAMKVMQTIGILVKSLVNIVYDLKEFELRLSHYKSANSSNKEDREAGILALKQIWMDNVDIKRGRGSINMLAQDLQFVTIRDAFMIANSVEQVKEMDLNDRVKRLLEPRVAEFLKWRELSEKELTKRYNIERTYLKSQVSSLKMYTRWAKPYLKAASQLTQKDFGRNPALVNAFDTLVLQLSIMGKSPFSFTQAVIDKKLPQSLKNKKLKREYYSCVLLDFFFRGIPQKVGQHYTFGGRVEVTFRSFALNKDELTMLDQKLDESDLNESLRMAEGMTTESLEQLKEEIDYFLKDMDEREKEGKAKKNEGDVNPFLALFGLGGSKKEKKEEKKKNDKIEKISSDSYIEGMARKLALTSANETCFTVFDVYKKAHGMASYPEWTTESPFEAK